ncbi:TetR/AcrR family transcriptional regulator C-terminal domain-containing protein [Streptomyces rubradiris]|uniref:GntR family transcriptional regulator n=1 Tax=Streptomyces rubradiris TaxID=285531 RepID=A0ABQ3RFS9_STRRR|nr:TetR/AcrR family transcriptional regulator C-terminal domain-containing protein [Streptomyces rubradiris]GHG96035.1 GntR family transcriptional regulator [Streptomyces rubradiris]GHI54710.1 GntR family transcriptional regulator [Streptomyces rubradiris]
MGGQAVPRYSQIVAELRQQIEAGELAPGDRVPSTREITKQWGVAMATATKVLTELRREGMVRAVPGVGTVVAAPSRPVRAARPSAAARPGGPSDASSAQAALTLGRIVGAAVTVADTEGLAAVSMRRVAAELGVATMSLYRHVADKDDLLVRMMDTVIAEHPLPADPPAGWREAIELAARQLWGLFRRHPWLAPALSVTRPQMIPSALPYSEWMLATLHAHGLDLHSAFTAHLMLLNYARGIAVNLESEREAEAHSGLDSEEWMDTQEPALLAILATGRLPALSRLAAAGYDLDLNALFEFGLQRLLDGLASLLHESSAG